MSKYIDCFIPRKSPIEKETKIPKNIIQTYKNNTLHEFLYDNIMEVRKKNSDYNYYLITDEIGVALIKQYFNETTLEAYSKLNLGAAKGDFLRYIAMYIYGGVYLDLDSSIEINMSSVIPDIEHMFFLDEGNNLLQWCFMISAKNPIMLLIINEMVKRIQDGEQNIYLATGPTLFTDVIFNLLNNQSNIYNTRLNVSEWNRFTIFMRNAIFNNGIILYEGYKTFEFKEKFIEKIKNYENNMIYENIEDRYIETFNVPTPDFYK